MNILFFGFLKKNLVLKIKKNNSAKYYLESYLSKAYLVFLNNYVFYSLILIIYIGLNFYFADVVYAEPGDIEDIKANIEYFQDQNSSILSQMEREGLNKHDNMLTPEGQAVKADYLEALRETKEGLTDNLRKLSLLKAEQAESVVATGKRLNSETTGGAENTDYKRRS